VRRSQRELHPLVRQALESAGKGHPLQIRRSVKVGLLRRPRGVLEMAVTKRLAGKAGPILDQFIRLVEGDIPGAGPHRQRARLSG
jgi:hypothetical protein